MEQYRFVLLFLIIPATFNLVSGYELGTHGFLMQKINQSAIDCFLKQNRTRFDFIIWDETGNEPLTIDTYNLAKQSGIPSIEAIWWLTSNKSGNYPPSVPASQIISQITNNNLQIKRIWLTLTYDFAGVDQDQNKAYLLDAVNYIQTAGFEVGIEGDSELWQYFFGDWSDETINSLPLIYYSLDGQLNFNDWTAHAFGGWTKPTGKDYFYSDCFDSAYNIIYDA